MSQIKIDKTAVNSMYADDIIAVLKGMIEDELSKDFSEVNTDFVDDCVNALLEIEKDRDSSFAVLVPLMSSEEYLNLIAGKKHLFKNLSKAARIAIIAAVAAASSVTVNATVEGVTGINLIKEAGIKITRTIEKIGTEKKKDEFKESEEKPVFEIEKTTKEETKDALEDDVVEIAEKEETITEKADNTTTSTTAAVSHNKVINVNKPEKKNETPKKNEEEPTESGGEETTKKIEPVTAKPAIPESDKKTKKSVFDSLEATYNNYKTDYIYGEKLSYDGLTLTAVYTGGERKNVKLSDCDYTKSVNMNVTADYTLRIIYKSCVIKIPITVRPDEETRGSKIKSNADFEYLLTNRGAYITKYLGTSKNIDIETIDGDSVYAICASVFENSEVRTVYAPNVKKIFQNAFKNSNDLRVITSDSAEYIGDGAFEGCEKLTNPSFSESASYIGDGAFKKSGIKRITVPDGMETVPKSLCEECENLETLDLNNAQTVNDSAFEGCAKLATVKGMGGVKNIGEFAFYGDEIAVFDAAPTGLEKVGDNGLAYCKKLEMKTLPSTVKEIGEYAFMYCTKMETANIGNGITSIPAGAFWGTHLKTLTLPDGLESIEQAAFMSTVIKNVTIPSTVKRIENKGLHSLTRMTVTFEGSPEYIDEGAFFNYSYLKFYAHENTTPVEYAEEHGVEYEIV